MNKTALIKYIRENFDTDEVQGFIHTIESNKKQRERERMFEEAAGFPAPEGIYPVKGICGDWWVTIKKDTMESGLELIKELAESPNVVMPFITKESCASILIGDGYRKGEVTDLTVPWYARVTPGPVRAERIIFTCWWDIEGHRVKIMVKTPDSPDLRISVREVNDSDYRRKYKEYQTVVVDTVTDHDKRLQWYTSDPSSGRDVTIYS